MSEPITAAPAVATWESLWQRRDADRASRRLQRERDSIRWRRFAATLEARYPGQSLRSVELGCGEGDFSVLLAERGHHVTLVDFSPAALDNARARFESLGLADRAAFVSGDLFAFAREQAGRFDLSISLGLAEHFRMDQRLKVIRAHRRVLRDGGTSLISVPNAHCLPYMLWMFHAKVRRWWRWGYEQPYVRREVLSLAREAGFTECQVYKSGFNAAMACMMRMAGRNWAGDRDGPGWANRWQGWDLNLLAVAR